MWGVSYLVYVHIFFISICVDDSTQIVVVRVEFIYPAEVDYLTKLSSNPSSDRKRELDGVGGLAAVFGGGGGLAAVVGGGGGLAAVVGGGTGLFA